jgi:RND superfamily putative drug exporter
MRVWTNWVLSHKFLIVVFWLIVTITGFAFVSRATGALTQQGAVPGGAAVTDQRIQRLYHNGNEFPIVPVVTLPRGTTVDVSGARSRLAAAFSRLGAVLPETRIASFAPSGNRAFVSTDGRTTFGLVYTGPTIADADAARAMHRILAGALPPGAHVHVTGLNLLANNQQGGSGPGVAIETLLAALAALLVLIFVFRSFMAVVPLLMAMATIPATFLLVWGMTAVTDVFFIVEYLVSLIGLGIAIDYSLLVVMRWREERARGLPVELAVVRAMETAGRAVILSGTTVAIGLLALIVLPAPFLKSIGYGGMLIPLVSVLVALTLLPIVLATVGPTLDWPPFASSRRASPFWDAWSRVVVRYRWPAAGGGAIVLGALILAATSLNLGHAGADSLTTTGDAHAGLKVLERAGINQAVLNPYEVLATGNRTAVVAHTLAGIHGVRGVVDPASVSWRRSGTGLIDVLPAADGNSASGKATLARVRETARAQARKVQVGGEVAEDADFIAAAYGNFPLMLVLIAAVTFVLLARAFRSILLPLKAVILNMLSVAAAWGIMVLVWQDGYGSTLIWGIPATGAIVTWVPLLVFTFLFGLSMDYEVFILARMREEYDATGSTNQAVIRGVARTGRLVTSAALILFLAFTSLAAGPDVNVKVIGTGLGAGILLDATIIRMLLVPALVSLLGRWNWWLPGLPARLLRVESSPAPDEAAA